MMTDERIGDALWDALARLPRGSGVVVRHYGLAAPQRRALCARISRIARARRLLIVTAGQGRLGRSTAGRHGRDPRRGIGLKTWPAHNVREIVAGRRAGADLFFISPVFATRSHPDAKPMGAAQAVLLARMAPGRAIALGGMNRMRGRRMQRLGFYGWAAIDAWLSRS